MSATAANKTTPTLRLNKGTGSFWPHVVASPRSKSEIEHILGEETVRLLEKRLNFATRDPHGKLIPGIRDIHARADGGRNPEGRPASNSGATGYGARNRSTR